MSYFEFPHTRSYDGDLGFIIKRLKELTDAYDNFFDYNTIKFHDPITWTITEDYPANNIVYDTQSETLYISKQAVPAGIDISNTEYWVFVSPFKIDTDFDNNSINPVANKTITNKISLMDIDISSLNERLSNEIAERTQNINNLSNLIGINANNISSEQGARIEADTLINARLDEIISGASVDPDAELLDIRVEYDGATASTAGDAVRAQVSALHNEIAPLAGDVDKINNIILPTLNYIEGYYITNDGSIVANDDYCVTEKIDISAIESHSGLFWYGTYNASYIKAVTFDAADNQVEYWGGISGSEYRNINNFGEGAKYIRFSFNKNYDAKLTSSISGGHYITFWKANKKDGLEKKLDHYYDTLTGKTLKATAGSLSSNEKLEINVDLSIRTGKVYHAFANISSFDTLYFGHGEDQYSLYFKLDNTNITFMTNHTEGSVIAHGLTLDTYIDILLVVKENTVGTLIINTLGGSFTREVTIVNGYKGKVFIEPVNCSIANVYIGFDSQNMRQPIWLFGDSYLTHTSDQRWPYYLVNWGFSRCLINAFPGEDSEEGYNNFDDLIPDYAQPSIAVWCLGMNDPDPRSNIINADWSTYVQQFIFKCENLGITPILSTIPNVPNYTHTAKNNWVKNSGYRYIDFAKAVGAEIAGSSWYTGALSSDYVHPTDIGARLLCLQALQDVPELLLGNI